MLAAVSVKQGPQPQYVLCVTGFNFASGYTESSKSGDFDKWISTKGFGRGSFCLDVDISKGKNCF